mgnify:CR=1 FL=1
MVTAREVVVVLDSPAVVVLAWVAVVLSGCSAVVLSAEDSLAAVCSCSGWSELLPAVALGTYAVVLDTDVGGSVPIEVTVSPLLFVTAWPEASVTMQTVVGTSVGLVSDFMDEFSEPDETLSGYETVGLEQADKSNANMVRNPSSQFFVFKVIRLLYVIIATPIIYTLF